MVKKILLVTDIFPPDIGGPASFIPDLARELTDHGHAVTVFCRSETPISSYDAAQPYRIVRVRREATRIRGLLTTVRLALEVLRHDHIFSNGLEYITRRVCQYLGRRYILKVVGDLAWEMARSSGLTDSGIDDFQSMKVQGETGRLVNMRLRFVRAASHIVTPSQYLRNLVIGWGYASDLVTMIPNGVRPDEFEPFQPQTRPGSTLKLVFAGRLVNWKGVDHLLQAIAGLTDVQLSIIGDGPDRDRLRQYAVEYALPVTFTGRCSRSETIRHIANADLLVLPSSYEGLSHTLLEACASGVPCIASTCGGNPEIIKDGVNGLLVPFGDVASLRAAIIRLRDNEEERYRLAQAAKETSKKFNFLNTVRETAQLITSQP